MTIKRLGSAEAVLAGYQCRECTAAFTKARKISFTHEERRTPLFASGQNKGLLPEDTLLAADTGIREADAATTNHDARYPGHHITLWQFDKDHPLTPEQVRVLRAEGVSSAESYR